LLPVNDGTLSYSDFTLFRSFPVDARGSFGGGGGGSGIGSFFATGSRSRLGTAVLGLLPVYF